MRKINVRFNPNEKIHKLRIYCCFVNYFFPLFSVTKHIKLYEMCGVVLSVCLQRPLLVDTDLCRQDGGTREDVVLLR